METINSTEKLAFKFMQIFPVRAYASSAGILTVRYATGFSEFITSQKAIELINNKKSL